MMNSQQIAEAIRTLEELRKDGLLSEEEFAHEKGQLLKQLREAATSGSSGDAKIGPAPTPVVREAADFFATGAAPTDFFATGGTPPPVGVSMLDSQGAQPVSESTRPGEPPHVHTPSPSGMEGPGAQLTPGQVLRGRYEIRRELGKGGMGVVYLVFDKVRQREIALKRIHAHLANDPEIKIRFIRELQINEHLTHPGIVRTYAIDEDPQHQLLFFTMEFVEGHSLETRLAASSERDLTPPLPLQESLSILRELSSVLDYAHAEGVIHRDLKPGNILLKDGGGIKLMDFGIAKIISHEHTNHHTGFVGTVYYMAPEQLKGGVVSPATDIYSLGILTYQMLTGEIFQGGMPDPSVLVPVLPREIDEVFRRAIHWKPEGRFQDATSFFEACARALSLSTTQSVAQNVGQGVKGRGLDESKDWVDRLVGAIHRTKDQMETASSGISGIVQVIKQTLGENSGAKADEFRDLQMMIQLAVEQGTLDGAKKAHILGRAEKLGLQREVGQLLQQLSGGVSEAQAGVLSQIRRLDQHDDWLEGCAFSPDGLEIATCGWDRKIRFWDVESGELLDTFMGHVDAVSACSYSADGEQFVSVSRDGCVCLWDIDDGQVVRTWMSRNVALSDVCFSSDGKGLVTAGWDFTLQSWVLPEGALRGTFSGHHEVVNGCALGREGAVFSVGDDGALKMWGFADGSEKKTLFQHSAGLSSLCVSLDGEKIACCGRDGSLFLVGVGVGSTVCFLEGGGVGLTCCAFSPDSSRLVVGGEDGVLRCWDVVSGRLIGEVLSHRWGVTDCVFSPEGSILASVGQDRHLVLWRVEG